MSAIRRYNAQNWLPSLFNDFFDNDWMVKANATAPAINVIESDTDYKVEVAAPGMKKEDFTIHVGEDNELTIAMEKKDEKKDEDKKNKRYLRQEFSYTQFEQTLVFYGQSHFVLRRDLRACQACAVAHGVEILLGFGRGVGLVEAFGIHEQHVGVAVYDVVATAGARLQALVVHVKVF